MRYIAYIVAVLVAAGIIYTLGKPEQPENTDNQTTSSSETVPPMQLATEKVTLSVPDMHCAFGCYPTVKKTLESLDGVAGVELAEQKSDDELDNRTVYVSHTSNFQLAKALKALKDAGFPAKEMAGHEGHDHDGHDHDGHDSESVAIPEAAPDAVESVEE